MRRPFSALQGGQYAQCEKEPGRAPGAIGHPDNRTLRREGTGNTTVPSVEKWIRRRTGIEPYQEYVDETGC